MAQRALIVGIAKYQDPKIGDIPFAEKDALKIREALERIGFLRENIDLLLTGEATQGKIGYYLEQIISGATENDEVVIYFSGHGTGYEGKNHFLCYDTVRAAPPTLTLPMERLTSGLASCAARRVLVFLDCCHAGLKLPVGAKASFSSFSEKPLEEFFRTQEFKVAFCSSKHDEFSYSSDKLQHSVWTHFLLQALNADVPAVIDEGRFLNGTKLQDYLFENVPGAVRSLVDQHGKQTPVCLNEVLRSPLIADLKKLVDARNAARAAAKKAPELFFQRIETQRSTTLANYDPEDEPTSMRTEDDLVRSWGRKEVEVRRKELFNWCWKKLGAKIAEIKQGGDSGSEYVHTPDVEVDVWMGKTSGREDAAMTVRVKVLDWDKLKRQEMAEFINATCDEIALTPVRSLDVREVAIRAESLQYIKLSDVDPDFKHCYLLEPKGGFRIFVEGRNVVFQSQQERAVLEIVDEVKELLSRLAVDQIDLSAGVPSAPTPAKRFH